MIRSRKKFKDEESKFKETLESCSESILKSTIKNNRKMAGITLLALVLTIVVLIILATVSINMLFGENGLVTSANMAVKMSEFSTFLEEKNMFDANKKAENVEYMQESLNAGKTVLSYNTQGSEATDGNIQIVIPSMGDEYLNKFEIINGELIVNTADSTEIEVARALGIQSNPYDIVDGVLTSSNENLSLQAPNGVLRIPDSVTVIGSGAFSGVKGLKEVIIPGTVQEIQSDAFSYNTEIEKVTIQNGVESIGTSAFYGCSSLKEITIPDSVTEIGTYAFATCTNLISVQMSNNVEILENYVFSQCTNLAEINIPTNLTRIDAGAFYNCPKLNNITIPAGVTNIDGSSLYGCANLTNVTIDSANEVYEMDENQPGIIYKKENGVRTSLIMLASMANEETVKISEGITELGLSALSICTNMKTLELPSSLSSIGGSAFDGLRLLTNISFPQGNDKFTIVDGYLYGNNGTELIYVVPTKTQIEINENVQIIKSFAIQNRNITELIIPDNVTTIERQIVRNTTNLKSIKIGTGVSSLNSNFKSYAAIQAGLQIEINSGNPYYKVVNNLILTIDGTEVVTYVDRNIQTQAIPDGVKKISTSAFLDFNIANAISLPDTLQVIGRESFRNCTNLTEIELPSSVETIEDNAFYNCSNLETIKINKAEGDLAGAPWGAPKGDRVLVWSE